MPVPDQGRAGRTGRRELHEPQAVVNPVVVVGVEADLLVERASSLVGSVGGTGLLHRDVPNSSTSAEPCNAKTGGRLSLSGSWLG
jgi:hypothetical protein